VLPLDCLRAAREDLKVALPLELVIWAEDEATFGLPMLGSRAYVGEINAAQLAQFKNQHGQSYLEAGAPHDVRADNIGKPAERIQLRSIIGLIETHVEQGVELWNS